MSDQRLIKYQCLELWKLIKFKGGFFKKVNCAVLELNTFKPWKMTKSFTLLIR